MPSPVSGREELDAVLAELVQVAHLALEDDLIAVYLHGSFAMSAADAESDCDFLVAVAEPLTPSQLRPIEHWHAELPHRNGYWNRHLEGSYAPVAHLSSTESIGQAWPYVDHGSDRVSIDAHCNNEYVRWTLHHHGVALYGPPASTLVDDVSSDRLRSVAARDLQQLVVTAEQRTTWDAWSQRYTLATAARMLRTATLGDVVSKAAAVQWAAPMLPSDLSITLRAAITQRGGTPWDEPIPHDATPQIHTTLRALLALGHHDEPPTPGRSGWPPTPRECTRGSRPDGVAPTR